LTNGKLLKLAANEETLSLNGNGEYIFSQTLKAGSAYNILIRQLPENMKCVLEKASGIATANVSDVSVSCYTPIPSSGITSKQCVTSSSNVLVDCNSAEVTALNAEQDGTRSSINTMDFGTLTQGANTYTSADCVKDKVTGLLWETKTADGGLRDSQKTYTHFDSTTVAQKSDGTKAIQAEIDAADNAATFVKQVNISRLCGFDDWRLPTARELHSIVNYGLTNIAIDVKVFINPGQPDYKYWTSSYLLDSQGIDLAFDVNFLCRLCLLRLQGQQLVCAFSQRPGIERDPPVYACGDRSHRHANRSGLAALHVWSNMERQQLQRICHQTHFCPGTC